MEVAVRPKCDMDAEEPIDNAIEKDAFRTKCDDEAEAVDEEQQQQTKHLKIMMKFQMKMWRSEGLLKKGETLQGERNNT